MESRGVLITDGTPDSAEKAFKFEKRLREKGFTHTVIMHGMTAPIVETRFGEMIGHLSNNFFFGFIGKVVKSDPRPIEEAEVWPDIGPEFDMIVMENERVSFRKLVNRLRSAHDNFKKIAVATDVTSDNKPEFSEFAKRVLEELFDDVRGF